MAGKNKKKINMKALRNGSYSVLVSVVVIALVVLMNMIVGQIPTKYTQFDISTGKLYTIGNDTKNVLKNLKQDITIYYVVQSGSEDSNIEKLLEQYEANSKHIKVVKKDPVVYPSFVTNYSEDGIAENSLIVECGIKSLHTAPFMRLQWIIQLISSLCPDLMVKDRLPVQSLM